jgi:nicotine oxidoreductase
MRKHGLRKQASIYGHRREGWQETALHAGPRRLFSTTVPKHNSAMGALTARLLDAVRGSKNKDGRYGDLIRVIGHPDTLTLAYLKIKGNRGALTPGLEKETLDGMSLGFLEETAKKVIAGSYQFSPTRVVEIPKPGKAELRPLGMSNPRQKIVQAALEMVLSAIFEPVFLDCSHGFRPGRGTHTALKYLQIHIGNASAYNWVVEGDIKGCFDNIPHWLILKGLRKMIDCPATLNLITKLLSAGFMPPENKGVKHRNRHPIKKTAAAELLVISPLLCNIALHSLDSYIIEKLKPGFEKGKSRKRNPELKRLRYKIQATKDKKLRRKLINESLRMNASDPMDPNFRRLHYVRYADDWIILIAGSYYDAATARNKVADKLSSMGLMLHPEKTRISHLRRDKCRFLGVDFFIRKVTRDNIKPVKVVTTKGVRVRKRSSPRLILHAPISELLGKLVNHGFAKRNHLGEIHPIGKGNCTPLTHAQILNFFNSKIRGILNYYTCIHNRMSLWSLVRILTYSCALTLARKFKLKTLAKTFKKFGRDLRFINKKGEIFKIYRPENLRMLAEFERFHTPPSSDIDTLLKTSWSSSMTQTQFDETCVICGTEENLEIHHIRSIKEVRVKARSYAQWVGGFLRKTIPLCKAHHLALHSGNLSHSEVVMLASYKGKMDARNKHAP